MSPGVVEKEFKAKKDYKGGSAKQRKKINDLVEQRKNETGDEESVVRKEIMKELRLARKQKKLSAKNELKVLEKQIKKEMAGQPEGVVNKAVRAAVAKHCSAKKKQKKNAAANKAADIMTKKIAEKWCPRDEKWFDKECLESFNLLFMLGAFSDMNIEKSTDKFEAMYPKECSDHIDLLAKKRFNFKWEAEPAAKETDETDSKSKEKPKKKKSRLEKALNEKLKNNPEKLSEQEILKSLVKQAEDTENKRRVKSVRKVWFPVNQAWYDQECQELAEEIKTKADELGLDLKNSASDFIKLKSKARELTKKYLQLLEAKKRGHSRDGEKEQKLKNKNKKKKNKNTQGEDSATKEELEDETARENKKIKFDDDMLDSDDADSDVVDDLDMEDTVEDLVEEEEEKEPTKPKNKQKRKTKEKDLPLSPVKAQEESSSKTSSKGKETPEMEKKTPKKAKKTPGKDNGTPAKENVTPVKTKKTPGKEKSTPKENGTPSSGKENNAAAENIPAIRVGGLGTPAKKSAKKKGKENSTPAAVTPKGKNMKDKSSPAAPAMSSSKKSKQKL